LPFETKAFHDYFCLCQAETPIIYILIIITSQHDVLNKTTVNNVQ